MPFLTCTHTFTKYWVQQIVASQRKHSTTTKTRQRAKNKFKAHNFNEYEPTSKKGEIVSRDPEQHPSQTSFPHK